MTCDKCGHNAWLVKAPCEHGEDCPFWVRDDDEDDDFVSDKFSDQRNWHRTPPTEDK